MGHQIFNYMENVNLTVNTAIQGKAAYEEMIEFAKFAKNYKSPNNVEEAFRYWVLIKKAKERGFICFTGDRFARVKPNGKVYSIYEMCWCYRPSERKGVKGKYFPTAYNLITHYVRTPQNTATAYDRKEAQWTVQMFLEAFRYIPLDIGEESDWKDNLHRVIKYDGLNSTYEKFPIPLSMFKD